jgi:hypothetical protein
MAHLQGFDLDIEEEDFIRALLNRVARPPIISNLDIPGAVIMRNCIKGHARLMKYYFFASLVYNNRMFERQFRMSRHLFNCLCEDLQRHHYFWLLKAVSTWFFLQ